MFLNKSFQYPFNIAHVVQYFAIIKTQYCKANIFKCFLTDFMANSYFDALMIIIHFVKNPKGNELPPQSSGVSKRKNIFCLMGGGIKSLVRLWRIKQ